jgi:hydroxyacylglutathione hydrolase
MYNSYSAQLLLPGVWDITDHSMDGGNISVDMYLIEGRDKALLIDAGDSKGDLAGFVRTLTDKPVDLLITHGHGDHAAGIHQFATVYMSHKDIGILEELFDIHPDKDKIIDLKGKEVFDLGGVILEVIALPGHTQGSMVLLDRERQLLFTSDSLGSGSIWMQLPHSSPLETYIKELKKLDNILEGMEDLKLFVGHAYQRPNALGRQYINDLRYLAEKIVAGEITGTPTEDQNEITGGLTVAYGQMLALVYKPNNIHEEGRVSYQ